MAPDLYSLEMIDAVWRQGAVIPGLPDAVWRRDRFGATIRRSDYGRTDTLFGWVVYQLPAGPGRATVLSRLVPVQWSHATLESTA